MRKWLSTVLHRFLSRVPKKMMPPRQELGVMDIDTGNEVRWISERLLSWRDSLVPPGDHFPMHTLAHLSRNICYTSPEGDTAWRIEPAMPFVTDVVMTGGQNKQLQELLRLSEHDCPALAAQAKHPPYSTERWCKDGGSIHSSIRRGFSRDADGDSLLEYVFYNEDGLKNIYFPNDTRPFIMLYPKECPQPSDPSYSHYEEVDDAPHLKKGQQCVAKAKEAHQLQRSSKKQSGE
jgi:hypothetical protein